MDTNVEKTNNKKGLIIALAVLVVLIVGGFLVYNLVFNKPKNIFLKNINSEYKKFSSLLVENDKVDIKTITSNLDFDFNIKVNELFKSELSEEDLKLIEEINALNFKMNMSADAENKLLSFVMDAKYNEDSLINVGAYGKPSSLYVNLKDIYDKYIEMPIEEYETLFEESNVNADDIEYVTAKVKDAFLNSLDENHFEKTSEKITVNGEEIKATKITYVLTEERSINISISVLNELKDDSKFIEIVASLSELNEEELKEELNTMIDELKEELEYVNTTDEVLISMYTKGIKNEAIKYSIKSDEEEIIYTDYEDKINLVFKDSEETYLTLSNVKNSDKSYKTEITMDTVKITIDSKEENKTWSHNYKLVESESMMEISGVFSYKYEEVNKNKEYNEDMKLTMSIGMTGIEIIGLDMTAKGTTKYNEDIILPDVSNSILYDSLTEEDSNTMTENMMKNETLVNFINTITELTADDSYEEDFDYDYDYDYDIEENIDYNFGEL